MSAAVAAALFGPALAHAAGLGQANVASGLGQPLRVEIDILNASTEELANLSARLAPFSDARNGTAPPVPLPADLRVAVEQRGRRAMVVITTRSPMNEPFVVLPVELSVGGAALVREFTLLLDPVEMRRPAQTSVAAVEPPAVQRAPEPDRPRAEVEPREPRIAPAAPVSAAPRAPAAPRPAAPMTTSGQRHLVQPGETLVRIASQLKQPSASTAQLAAAIHRANPDAFINGDVNKLIAGRQLAIPDADSVRTVDPNEAARLVGMRNEPQQPGAANNAPAPKVQAPARQGDTLTLAPDRARSVDRLGVAEDRVAELEKSIEQLEALVARQALMIQQMAEEQRRARGETAPAGAQGAAAVGAKPDATAGGATPSTNTSAAPAAPAAAPTVQSNAAQPASEASDSLFGPLYAGLGVLAVGLLGLWGMRRFRNRDQRFPEEPSPTLNVPVAPAGGENILDLDLSRQPEGNPGTADQLASLGVSSVMGLDSLHSGLVDTEINPIAEAEVYLAYGRSAQAEEVLREALDRNPANEEVALRLLEIYADRKDAPAVEATMKTLAASTKSTGPSWERARAVKLAMQAGPTSVTMQGPTSQPVNFDPFSSAPKAEQSLPSLDVSLSPATEAPATEAPDTAAPVSEVPKPANMEFSLEDLVRPNVVKRDFG